MYYLFCIFVYLIHMDQVTVRTRRRTCKCSAFVYETRLVKH